MIWERDVPVPRDDDVMLWHAEHWDDGSRMIPEEKIVAYVAYLLCTFKVAAASRLLRRQR